MFTEPPRSAETHACGGRARVVNLFCHNKKYSTAVDTTRVYSCVHTRDRCLKLKVHLLSCCCFAFLLFCEHLYRTARLFNYKRQNYGEAKNPCPHHENFKSTSAKASISAVFITIGFICENVLIIINSI